MIKKTFRDRLLPAPLNGGFKMDNYWVWCGSVIKGDDGKYHIFASRWPRSLSFNPHWLTNSEVVRGVSESPEGPYRFEEVVLRPRGEEYWDGKMTHNPAIRKVGDTYLLFYTGTTYHGDMPTPDNPTTKDSPLKLEAHSNERVGVAFSNSVYGPWERLDYPILDIRPGTWEGYLISNPAPCVLPDGSILLMYKAVESLGKHAMGIAKANHFKGPYVRMIDKPFLIGEGAEDPCIWYENGQFHALMLDHDRKYSEKEIIYGTSPDGLQWKLAEEPLAISKNILWEDGVIRRMNSSERPQILLEEGQSTHVFFATGSGEGESQTTWSMSMPLKPF